MSRSILPRWIREIVIFAVTVGLIGGLWISYQAVVQKYRLGQSAAQMVQIIAHARNMRLTPQTDPRAAERALMEEVNRREGQELVQIQDANPQKETPMALLNPWGRLLRVFIYPTARAIRLQTEVDPPTCRRFLAFYEQESTPLGLRRIDVQADRETGLWRQVYQDGGGDSGDGHPLDLSEEMIHAACGERSLKVISMTFVLPQRE